MTTRQILQICAWGIGVLVAVAVVIVVWAWPVPEIEDAQGRLVTDTARVQTRTLVVLLGGFVVMLGGGFAIARRGHRSTMTSGLKSS